MTDAGRFRPLQEAALELLHRLERTYDVARSEGYGLDAELEPLHQLSRPTVRLVPADPAAAPVVVAFTSFPGVVVRCGMWLIERFPACGCDACAETAEGEAERLHDLLANVTGGRFRESISIPLIGSAWYEYELGAPWHGRGRMRLTRSQARQLLGKGVRTVEWKPWH